MKHLQILLVTLGLSILLAGCSDNEVGEVSLGVFTTKDIKLDMLQDPIVTGVSCHIAHVKQTLILQTPLICLSLAAKQGRLPSP